MRLTRVLIQHIIILVNQPLRSRVEVFLYKLINYLLTKTCIMKTSYVKNPKRLLGYLMAFAMVFFSTSSVIAEDLDITVGGGSWTSEVSWEIVDASGISLTGVQMV